MEHLILRDLDIPNLAAMDVYAKHSGYLALRKAVKEMTPEQVTDTVKAAGLRGRGGAGFPAGVKWSFLPKDVFPKYVVVNGDESEAGTFKDHQLIENNPHQVIEGVMLCSYAVQAATAYIYLRGEFYEPAKTLQKAIDEAYGAGLLGKG